MCSRIIAILVGLAATADSGTVVAQKITVFPGTRAPEFVIVTNVDVDKDQLSLGRFVAVPVTKTVTEKVVINGRTVERKRTVTDRRTELRETRYALTSIRFHDVKGKQLERKDVLKLLEKGRMVLLSADGKPVDPQYRKVLDADALILIAPKSPTKVIP